MNATLMNRVKTALKSKHYMVNESWLQDCMEFYISDQQNENSLDSLLSFITSQWQLCDLCEINNDKGCLPNNLAQQKYVNLPGKYILQMNSIYDISTSKYKQLEKIRNVSTENIDATESDNMTQLNTHYNTQSNSSSWELKTNRIMYLKLTDGKQNIAGIEHKPIHLFDDLTKLLPGFKIMIKGPIICRHGVLLLEEKNLLPIGGEVDSLLIPNAIENIFARALKMVENPNPYGEDINSQNNVNSQNNINSGGTNNSTISNTNISGNTDIANNYSNQNPFSNVNFSTTAKNYIKDDLCVNDMFQDDLNEIDLIALDEEIERNYQAQNNLPSIIKSSQNQNDIQRSESVQVQTSSNQSNDISKNNRLKNLNTKQKTLDWCFKKSVQQTTKRSTELIDSTKNIKSENIISKNKANTEIMDLTNDVQNNFQIAKLPNTVCPNVSVITSHDIKRDIPHKNEAMLKTPIQSKLSLNMNVLQSVVKNENTNISQYTFNNSGQKRSSDDISPPIEKNPSKVRCLEEMKIKNFHISSNSSTSMEFCDLLCDILKETLVCTPIKKTIRGKVHNVSKLTVVNSRWCLNATLTDDTSNVEVEFSSEVLDKLFGFTVKEFQKKKKMKKDPEIMTSLKQDLSIAEQKLIKLDALVELEFSKDKKPLVTKISELTEEQKRQINIHVANLKKT